MPMMITFSQLRAEAVKVMPLPQPLPVPQPQLQQEVDNPLLNHIVLQKVLSSGTLSFTDLKNIRLVCSLWHNISLDVWTKSAIITFSPNTKLRTALSISELSNRYESKVGKLGSKPYTMYKLKNWKPSFDPVHSSVIPPEFSFGPVVAPKVEYLHINECNFSEAEKFEEIVFQCENLQELVLSGNTFLPKTRNYEELAPIEKQLRQLKRLRIDGIMTLGWYRFILHTPCIESLTIKQSNTFSRFTLSEFLNNHSLVHRRHRLSWPLKHLDLSHASGSFHHLKDFRSSDFPLQSLTIQWEKLLVDNCLVPIFQGCCKNLQNLEIICITDQLINRVPAPTNTISLKNLHYASNWNNFPFVNQMEALTKIQFWGCVVDNLDFLRFTPNLQILIMNRTNFEKRQLMINTKDNANKRYFEEGSVDVVANTVECWNLLTKQPVMLMDKLETFFVDSNLGIGSMYTLRRWMPNVKVFGMVFTNSTFQLACEEWPKLEEIRVTYRSVVTDQAVTAAYFLNLKGLKKFTMDCNCHEGWFTDKAVHEGFLKMPSLRFLKACVSRQMTNEATRLLKQKIARVRIIRNYTSGLHADYNCCQRLAFKKERKKLWNNDPNIK